MAVITPTLSKWQNSDAIFNIKPIRCQSHKWLSPKVFTFKKIIRVRFVYKCYRNSIEKTIVTWAWEMQKQFFGYMAQSVEILCRYFCSYLIDVERYQYSFQHFVSNIFCRSVNRLDISRFIQTEWLISYVLLVTELL